MVDTVITLYDQNERIFSSNGLGSLNDAENCEVYEERNGEFELTMRYPVFGRHFSEIGYRKIIFAKPNPYDIPQPFRIYRISKPINGMVTISAHHISYDLSGYPMTAFKATGLTGIFNEMNAQMSKAWNSKKPAFHFSHNLPDTTKSEFNLVAPCSARALLGGSEGTVLDRFHGEYEWNRWDVVLHKNRGADRGVTIAYGKNLVDFEQEENCDNVWTAVYPYWYSEEYGLVEMGTTQKTIPCPGTYDHERIYMLDVSDDFEEKPTPAQVKEQAEKFVAEKELGVPDVSINVSFVNLADTTNYQHIQVLQTVKLCDTIRVEFPKMKVATSAKCVATRYNVLTNKYIEVQLGNHRSNLASTISGQSSEINDRPTKTMMERTIDYQTRTITGNNGGYMIIHDSDGDGKPDETLFMDTDDIATAKNVLRMNKSGIGFSKNGYNGPYETAWTLDGVFSAKFITAGTMLADRIKGGTLSLGGSSNGNGAISLYNASGKLIGKIDNTGLYLGPNNEFSVDMNGKMSASKGEFLGSVQAKNIKASDEDGYITGGKIKGGTLSLGGSSNGNGAISLYNASGKLIGKIDNTGLYLGPNNEFSVDMNGKMSAKEGSFLGNVYAKNIKSGGDAGYITGSQIGDKAIGSSQLNDKAVDSSKLGDKAVDASKIADKAVGASKIADAAVGSAQLGSKAVGSDKLGDGSVIERVIGSGAVSNTKLGDDSVNHRTLESGSVYNDTLSGGSVSQGKLTSDLQDVIAEAVYANKIVTGTETAGFIYCQRLVVQAGFSFGGRWARWAEGILHSGGSSDSGYYY